METYRSAPASNAIRSLPPLLKQHFDLILLAALVCALVFIAIQRLGAVPLPETDEAFTLQVPYEMLYRGKLALPMLRYLGGNIENVWHSYTPLYFVLLTGFFKIFGFGLAQGRAFNLVTAVLTLLATYSIGRRFFSWRVGLVAAVFLISDLTFLERARMLRNDYAAAAFAMLAFYLFELAERRKRGWLFVASGLAAGAGVMCHTNVLYMLGALCLLLLMKHGLKVLKSARPYQLVGCALLVMAYEIIYDLIDYKNFLLQNRADSLHFGLLEKGGLMRNIAGELGRYKLWYAARADHYGVFYGAVIADIPRTLLHLFQMLAAVAIVYLVAVCVKKVASRQAMSDLRVHVLVVTAVVVVFHAVLAGHKEIYYMAHLAPWFAICAGILINDGLAAVGRRRLDRWPTVNRLVRTAGAIAVSAYVALLVWQSVLYFRDLRNPDIVSFNEYTVVLREIVPEGLCPVAQRSPAVWLAFLERDQCFATIEARMRDDLDLRGNEYAYVSPENTPTRPKHAESFHLLGEMLGTAYGLPLRVYYTGSNPAYLSLAPKRYRFFGWHRGHELIEDEESPQQDLLAHSKDR